MFLGPNTSRTGFGPRGVAIHLPPAEQEVDSAAGRSIGAAYSRCPGRGTHPRAVNLCLGRAGDQTDPGWTCVLVSCIFG